MSLIISFISGIATSIGIGGGTILISGLMLFLGIDQRIAQSANLFFFIPTSITAIVINARKKIIKWDSALIIIFNSILGAVIGFYVSTKIKLNLLKRLFGLFIGIVAIYEIYTVIKSYINNKKSNNKK